MKSIRSFLWGSRLRRILSVIAAGVFVLVLVAWAAVEWWLIPKAAKRVAHELARSGYHITYRDPDLSLLRGSLSLEDITLYRTAEKVQPLLSVSELGVRIDLGELLWRQAIWGESQIRDGRVVVYGEKENIELRGLAADFDLDHSRLRINRFESETNFGYQLRLAGTVRWADPAGGSPIAAVAPGGGEAGSASQATGSSSGARPDPGPAPASYPDFPGDLDWAEDVVEVVRCEPEAGAAAVLADLELVWDETRSPQGADGSRVPFHQLVLRGTLSGGDVAWRDLPLDSLDTEFTLEAWEIAIPSFELRCFGGAVAGAGTYVLDTDRLELRGVRSDADPLELLRRFDPGVAEALAKVEYDTSPELRSEQLVFDFRDLGASEVGFTIDAPAGIRYREGDEVLEADSLRAGVEVQSTGGMLFEPVEATVNGLRLTGRLKLGAEPEGGPGPVLKRDPPPTAVAIDPQPATADIPAPPSGGQGSPSLVAKLNEVLRFEAGQAGAPELELDVEFEPGRGLAGLVLSGGFAASDFRWSGREIETAKFDVSIREGELAFRGLRFVGLGGEFEGEGSYHIEDRALGVPRLRSTVDLATLSAELGVELPGVLGAIEFPAPPVFRVEDFELQLGGEPRGSGRVELAANQGFILREGDEALSAQRFDLAMAWTEPGVLTVEHVRGGFGDLGVQLTGELRWEKPAAPAGGAADDGETAEARVVVEPRPTPNPAVDEVAGPAEKDQPSLIGLLKDYLTVESQGEPVDVIGQFNWDGRAGGERVREWYEQLGFEASITGRNYTWREFEVIGSNGTIALDDAVLTFGPFELETRDGSLVSEASYAIESKRLHLVSLQLTIDPMLVIERSGIGIEGPKGTIEFLGKPEITGNDVLFDFSDHPSSKGRLLLRKADGIALVTPSGRKAVLGDVRASMEFGGGVVEVRDMTAEFLGGAASGGLKIVRDPAAPSYEVAVGITGVSIAAANEWLYPSNEFIESGTFDLRFEGRGIGGLESLEGEGRAAIGADAPAARDFPVLGGLMGALEGYFPILRREQSWELDLPFAVAGGVVSTENTQLTSRRVRATVRGGVDWVNGQVDLRAGVNVRGLLGVAANVARPFRSGFVEFVGRGPFDDVRWGLAATQRMREEEPRRGGVPRPFRNR